MARGCGAKHTCKSNCTKNIIAGPMLPLLIRKNASLWREAHFSATMHKTPQSRSNFGGSDVQKSHAAVAPSTFVTQNAQNTNTLGPLFEDQMSN